MATKDQSLSKNDLAADPSLRGLGELARYADTNGDNRLSVAELEAFGDLIQLGVKSQVWVHVRDRGRNLFPLLDADGDGRLSVQELTQARTLAVFSQPTGASAPWQFQLSLRGPSATAWAGFPLPVARIRATQKITAHAKPENELPRWFQAADRNHDGVISPREFLGSPKVFRKLDADGNGVISAEEARR